VADPPEAGPQRPELQGDRPGDRQPPAVPPRRRGGGHGGRDRGSGFHRERFLLRLVAVILIAEVLLFTLASAACIALAQRRPLSDRSLCHRADSSLEAAFGVALNTLLALLGGKAASDSLR